jgi:hypothetical protein
VVLNAVASLAALMVLAAAFGLTLAGVVFFDGLLLIRDFFVIAMMHLLGFEILKFLKLKW